MTKRFVVNQKNLVNVLSAMQPICTKRTTIDATTSILFQVGHRELVLKSTDLEISLQASCHLEESNFTEPETFLVPGRRIFDVVKELDASLVCTLTNNQLTLKSENVDLALNIKDAQEFPPFPERIENLMHLDAPCLLEMLDKVAFLIPQNNAYAALNGLLLEISQDGLNMTATDGHCLAQVTSPHYTLSTARTWLLPRRAVFELKKILESSADATIFLGVCGNQLVFSGELFNFFTKLLVDPFPQYQAILDKTSFVPARIDRSKFVKTLRRSACLLSGQFLATKFTFTPATVQVTMHNKEVGALNEALPLEGFVGEPCEVRFYAPYLLNGLQAFKEESVNFFIKNSARPLIFEAQQKSGSIPLYVTYLVMPVSPTTAS